MDQENDQQHLILLPTCAQSM